MIKFVAQFSHGNLDIISASPLLRHFAHVSCDSPRRLLEYFLEDFYVNVDTDPEVDSPVALGKLEFFLRALYLTVTAPISSVRGF